MSLIEMNLNVSPVHDVIPILLLDRTTKKNIIFATESYAEFGEEYGAKNHITEQALEKLNFQPRVLKKAEEQVLRTRKKAEVFTPAWVCCMMNNHADTVWFKRDDVFGTLKDTEWIPSSGSVTIPRKKRWQAYVDARRLEITCGEAPYLVTRYDMGTGEIIPISQRMGLLDRKLRIVNENAQSEEEWLKWCIRAFQAVYGYEYQGDNLIIARANLLMTFVEYLNDRWHRDATAKELHEIAFIISWNIWQMDGLKGIIPMGALYEKAHQVTLFELFSDVMGKPSIEKGSIPCRIYDWRGQNQSVEFNGFEGGKNGSMKFDFIIGNPPYQEEMEGTSDTPVYNHFMDAAYEIGEKVELITPARFLFNAGKTPKVWNQKMLYDENFTVLSYEPDGTKVFPGTEIKGGVAVHYHDRKTKFGAIEVFTAFEELNDILKKVKPLMQKAISDIVYSPESYKFTDILYQEHPEIRNMTTIFKGKEVPLISKGHDYDLTSNIFEKLAGIVFFEDKPADGHEYVQIFGRQDNARAIYYIDKRYVSQHDNLDAYKLLFPKSNGSGKFGEPISIPAIGYPQMGHTQTFLSMGAFKTEEEVKALMKYVKCKFVRTMLGVLKVTQDNKKGVWRFVPMQDFTSNSDINWSVPIKAIDQQLYKKYGLSDEEITFIETHVKEMS